MPNHVINEVTFRAVTPEQQAAIMATVRGKESVIDFEVLLPIPLNMWWWSAGTSHEKAFPGTALDWCRENWSTKWNAYGLSENDGADARYHSAVQTDDTLTLTFRTAWSAPMGWLCALFNKHGLPFEYGYLSEGNDKAFTGFFRPDDGSHFGGAYWEEKQANEMQLRHLHKLLWGVEEFPDEGDDE